MDTITEQVRQALIVCIDEKTLLDNLTELITERTIVDVNEVLRCLKSI